MDTDELRQVADECHPESAAYRLTHEAADEIERLRGALAAVDSHLGGVRRGLTSVQNDVMQVRLSAARALRWLPDDDA